MSPKPKQHTMSYKLNIELYDKVTLMHRGVAVMYCTDWINILNDAKCPCANCDAGVKHASFECLIKNVCIRDLNIIISMMKQIMNISHIGCDIRPEKIKGTNKYKLKVMLAPLKTDKDE
jgi:hypothetical protein